MSSLYAMAIVHRRDIKSIRDLKKTDSPWLREMQKKIIQGLRTKYPEVDEDQLRVYVHCKFQNPSIPQSVH
jgi:m7GpppX diphosphatase